jgi:transcriptional regulator with XRE-family HTH domain
VTSTQDLESVTRLRLRSLRTTQGFSLHELAERTHLHASTISRVETGKRALSLDVLVPLAQALQVSLDVLFEMPGDEDVVIRPVPRPLGSLTTWPLNRPDGRTTVLKMRLEPPASRPEQRVHPGHDWFVVTLGRVRLWLGDREIDIETGEAAEFSTMTPHSFSAVDGPAEIITIFNREGHQAHLHHEDEAARD